jgi:hypothetical protein
VLYPPRDICFVNVPADHPAFPGCGQAHARPTGPDGELIHPWGLSCPDRCEPHLAATDPRFVRRIAEIPLTYDEAKAQEQLAVRGPAAPATGSSPAGHRDASGSTTSPATTRHLPMARLGVWARVPRAERRTP